MGRRDHQARAASMLACRAKSYTGDLGGGWQANQQIIFTVDSFDFSSSSECSSEKMLSCDLTAELNSHFQAELIARRSGCVCAARKLLQNRRIQVRTIHMHGKN